RPSSHPAFFRNPTTGDPTSPARFAHMLMNPTATAAADDVSACVGSTQYGDSQKYAQNPVRQSQVNTTAHGWPGMTLQARKVPARTRLATQCHFRSRVRSDDQ